jgi:hypothetical protein
MHQFLHPKLDRTSHGQQLMHVQQLPKTSTELSKARTTHPAASPNKGSSSARLAGALSPFLHISFSPSSTSSLSLKTCSINHVEKRLYSLHPADTHTDQQIFPLLGLLLDRTYTSFERCVCWMN